MKINKIPFQTPRLRNGLVQVIWAAFASAALLLSGCKREELVFNDLNLHEAFSFENWDGRKTIKRVYVHCSASSSKRVMLGKDIMTVAKQRGFLRPPYHFYINRYGTVDTLCKFNDDIYLDPEEVCWGVAGINSISLHVCYEGCYVDKPHTLGQMTPVQRLKMTDILRSLKKRYPDIIILGHNEHPGVRKACPGFKASEEFSDL